MTAEKKNNSNASEPSQAMKIIEYHDYFINSKNKKVNSKNLGEKTAELTSFFYEYINGYNIASAYVKRDGKKSIAFNTVEEFPFITKIFNAADTRTAKIFSVKNESQLQLPIIEYHYGNAKESVIGESHIISFDLCSYEDLKFVNRVCSKLNAIVKSFFERRNVSLLELTCRFGKFEGKVLLIDDFSPQSIKIASDNADYKLPDAYKIETAAQMNKYSDFLLKLIKGE
jgi:phosphoribosylaminoimidazole-succinocarboxamide synthase